MSIRKSIDNRLGVHLAGLLLLLAVHFLADYGHFLQREGLSKFSPYLFLIMLYGWIIFHNLILFDSLFLKGKKKAYIRWTTLAMLVSTLNMFFILHDGFSVGNPLPQILNFWIYTLLGLGIYMTYRYLRDFGKAPQGVSVSTGSALPEAGHFEFTANGKKQRVLFDRILFLESLENYVKIHTLQKTYLVRHSLKEAEQRLPGPIFIRVSRSHILNTLHIHTIEQDSIRIGEQSIKIGKVYKKYVEDQLASLKLSTG